HRRLTGEGQHIDVSQAEAAIHLLAPAILDYEVNGRTWRRMGNRDLALCPHGVYPARGEDRWVAIACQSDAAWQALCEVMGLDEAAADLELATAEGRRQRADELDGQIAGWTCSRDEREVESALIAAGVAAHVVQNTAECEADPQLRHRDHFRTVVNASAGELVVEGSRFQLSRTPARVERAGPELGEHNFGVLEEILGYDSERIAALLASGAMR
ncbi:MAG: CoA transferase, partial [Gammaproteobacteria bacterium]|nr:CoA transferase [Gammaproteobacteria bacterium]